MLIPRIITAIIMAVVLVGFVLFLSFDLVKLLFTGMLFIAAFELLRLVGIKQVVVLSLMSAALSAAFYFTYDLFNGFVIYQSVLISTVFWLSIIVMLFMYRSDTCWTSIHKVFHGILGISLLFISIHSLLFLHLHFLDGGWFLLYVMSIVWVADIGAYFSGKRFGKHKLAPSVSPGKTIEGVAGGLVLNIFWSWFVFSYFFQWGMALEEFMLISVLTSLISVVGDLYESILKRQAGMKDSGKILPGHGGLLDRIDSVIAAAPVFVFGLFAVGVV